MKTTIRLSRFFSRSSIILLVSSTLMVGEAAAITCPSNLNLITCTSSVIASSECQSSIKSCTASASALDAADGVLDGRYFGGPVVSSYTTVKYCTVWTANCRIS